MLEICHLVHIHERIYMYRKQNWTNEFWQPVCGEWMGDVLRTENLPQHISRSLLRSTQQSCTWKPDRTGLIFVITYQVPSLSEKEHKMHINSNNTHTHFSLFIPQLFRSVFVQCYWLVCKTLPICTIFCSFSCFALRHLPAHWVSGAFSFGWLDVCFAACIGCSVQHICIYTLILMPHFVLDIHTSYSLYIASYSHKMGRHGYFICQCC